MKTESVAMAWTSEYLESRHRELKADPFIKGCLKAIEHIVTLATPKIRIDLGDVKYSTFEIDEKSKQEIAYYQKAIDDHITAYYPEFKAATP